MSLCVYYLLFYIQVKIEMGQYNNNDTFSKAVDAIPFLGGFTLIKQGLELAQKKLFGPVQGGRYDLMRQPMFLFFSLLLYNISDLYMKFGIFDL